jgi:predicted TIM-barrel fold metal-dependent hydrolase
MISRREWLQGVAAGGAAVAAGAVPAAVPEPLAGGLVDAHVHVWAPDLVAYPLAEGFARADMQPPSFTADELLALCRPLGVARVVLIQMSFYGFDNRYLLDSMARHPGTFGGVAIVDHASPGVVARMRELAARGVRGFRLYTSREKAATWEQDAGMKAMWTCGADDGLAMCLLADPDALPIIERMCTAFPKTPVVIDHFARIGMRGAVDRGELDRLLGLAKFPQVHVKTSAFYALGKKAPPYDDLGGMIRELRDAYGAQRLMWATDCPYQAAEGHGYAASLALVRERLDFLSVDDRKAMLRDTATRLFFPNA